MTRAGAKGNRATHWRLTTMRYICAQTTKPPTATEAVTRKEAKDARGERALFDSKTARIVALVVDGGRAKSGYG